MDLEQYLSNIQEDLNDLAENIVNREHAGRIKVLAFQLGVAREYIESRNGGSMVNEEYVMRVNETISRIQRLERVLQNEADTTPPYSDRNETLFRIKKLQLAVEILSLNKPVR